MDVSVVLVLYLVSVVIGICARYLFSTVPYWLPFVIWIAYMIFRKHTLAGATSQWWNSGHFCCLSCIVKTLFPSNVSWVKPSFEKFMFLIQMKEKENWGIKGNEDHLVGKFQRGWIALHVWVILVFDHSHLSKIKEKKYFLNTDLKMDQNHSPLRSCL